MKKIILWTRKGLLPMLLALILSTVTVPVRTASALPTPTGPWTMVYLDPPTIIGQTVGQVFTIDLNIFNATAIHGWQSGFIFNATLLTCTGFSEGEFMSSQASTSWTAGTIDNTKGLITAHGCNILGTDSASGNGRLAYLTFQVKAPGVSDLHFSDVTVVEFGIPPMVPINIVDVYTVVVDTSLHTVETFSDVSGKAEGYVSSFRDHAFSVPDEELSFTIENPISAFANVTIPKTLMEPEPLYAWGVIINNQRLSESERTITENATHTSLYFTFGKGIHHVKITTRITDSTVPITLNPATITVGSSATISGGIVAADATVRPGVNVTIQYRPSGGNWTTLATVTTDLNGNYSYSWMPETVETYEVKASWEGDLYTLKAESGVLPLEVIRRDLIVSSDAPIVLVIGGSSLLNATVQNSGTINETDVELQLLIDGEVKNSTLIPLLQVGSSYTISYNWTPTEEARYNVTAYAPPVIFDGLAENDTTNNVATKFVMVGWLVVNPPSGPSGTKATLYGADFTANSQVNITFNDVPIGYATTDGVGRFEFVFNVLGSAAGNQTITAFDGVIYRETVFTVIDITPLDIEIDVGTTAFRGELAEFYVQITFKGTAVDATSISALLYKPGGTTEALTAQRIATGFYKTTYLIPEDALTGTYVLVIEASYITSTIESYGASLKTFLLSSTLTDALALIEDLKEQIAVLNATLMDELALIEDLFSIEIDDLIDDLGGRIDSVWILVDALGLQLKAVNATINATINATLTDSLALISAINSTLQSLSEAISRLETRTDTIKVAQESSTPILYGAMALSLIAAVGAILSTILLRRRTPAKSKPLT